MDVLRATFLWLFQFIVQLVGIILGIFLMPIFLLFADDSKKELTYKTDGTNEWWLRTLPKFALFWDNKIDGTLGDDDYRYASRDIPFGLKNTSFLGQYWWMAFRNPFNYFKRFILACDVRKDIVEKIAGQDYVRDDLNSSGWQFLKCGNYYTFYGVWKWKLSDTHAVVIQLGNKFDLQDNFKAYPSDQEYKYFKGFTFEINLYKDIS
ncbi:lysozyme [Pseudomonas phage vB_PsaM_M1]|nr:lysozyme [Pseudomonas phage vB_PsaM_M1]